MGITIKQSYQFFLAHFFLAIGFYFTVLRDLAREWWDDPNYSHGFLIPIVVGYMIWQKRKELEKTEAKGSWSGLFLVLIAIFSYYFGEVCSVVFASRISLVLWVYGCVVFLYGYAVCRVLLFPLVFLLFMIPLPYLLYDSIAFPLKLVASQTATTMLGLAGIPVYLEGNIISLPTMVLEVADACSGIRSLFSLFAFASIVAYLGNKNNLIRGIIIISAVPFAVLTNSFRIFGTGVLVGMGYEQIAEGFFHSFSGWFVSIFGFGLIFGASRIGFFLEARKDNTSR